MNIAKYSFGSAPEPATLNGARENTARVSRYVALLTSEERTTEQDSVLSFAFRRRALDRRVLGARRKITRVM